jgi:D-alanyl-lipoteichoic acid acyltransferase DltB (MBOAT superfamily)
MLFNSFQYVVFFPVVAAIFFLLPFRCRWIHLLASSYFFYMCWKAEYALLLLLGTLVSYLSAILLDRSPDVRTRKVILAACLTANLSVLFGFKYFNFFNGAVRDLLGWLNLPHEVPYLNVLLPVGISFYTFQSLGYVIDVYRRKSRPEKHLGIFAVYVSFFPQILAGPIERSTRLLPQFYKESSFSYDRAVLGLTQILWGLFKKIVIADQVSVVVDAAFKDPQGYAGVPMVLAAVLYAFQIYCDFSGYSDMAVGSARIMGFELMQNFRQPYFAKSISEFWSRWHISLSTWFRDYMYIPLGGNRVVRWRWYYNLFLTFLVSGLWHGANWTFILWGAWHGLLVIMQDVVRPVGRWAGMLGVNTGGVPVRALKIVSTFTLVVIGWVLFRAESFGHAVTVFGAMSSGITEIADLDAVRIKFRGMGIRMDDLLLYGLFIAILLLHDLVSRNRDFWISLREKPLVLRWSAYYLLLFFVFFFSPQHAAQNFIYFQF